MSQDNKKKVIWFKFDSTSAIFPKRGTNSSAGYDLYADANLTINPGESTLVQTNIGIILPQGTYGRIAPRSSLAYKYGLDVFAGVIDSDYRGKIGVILFNSTSDDFIVKKGDRIAQLIVERCYNADEVQDFNLPLNAAQALTLWDTNRKDGGFGSTGK